MSPPQQLRHPGRRVEFFLYSLYVNFTDFFLDVGVVSVEQSPKVQQTSPKVSSIQKTPEEKLNQSIAEESPVQIVKEITTPTTESSGKSTKKRTHSKTETIPPAPPVAVDASTPLNKQSSVEECKIEEDAEEESKSTDTSDDLTLSAIEKQSSSTKPKSSEEKQIKKRNRKGGPSRKSLASKNRSKCLCVGCFHVKSFHFFYVLIKRSFALVVIETVFSIHIVNSLNTTSFTKANKLLPVAS